eukprot:GGOE01004881.1.p1 GENE.GGOE01004881.1~~GGOE01004881.1.p1  ORF type:complete len:517 (-),score=130.95 GGOE01004881.1:671-2221(-)
MPLMLAVSAKLSPFIHATSGPIVGSAIAAFYASSTAVYITVLRRREFQADHELQQSLANEAKAMQELACQEVAHKESAQEADSILNHSLKNMMADAAGCIHLYLQTLTGPRPVDLTEALTCLDRGMGWCRKRQALLRVAAGRYVPLLAKVNLREMGSALVRGRKVSCSIADADVLLDSLLTELVLDNALNSAFRHGHPETPDVHFNIVMDDAHTGEDNQFVVTFEVRNRSHPERPPVTSDLVCQVLNGEDCYSAGTSALSEHLGLQHMFLAAQACGMALTLEQEEDVVVLHGLMSVEGARPLPSSVEQVEDRVALPAGLRIFCVDDSAVARRLLHHAFSNHPSRPRVHVFGATVGEVEEFMFLAPQSADIVILDHHLDYGLVHYLGPQLLQLLLQKGYTGVACIRSANVSAENQGEYLQLGAHCAIGKDANPRELVDTIARAYLQHQCARNDTASPQSTTTKPTFDSLLTFPTAESCCSLTNLVSFRSTSASSTQVAPRDRRAAPPPSIRPYATLR